MEVYLIGVIIWLAVTFFKKFNPNDKKSENTNKRKTNPVDVFEETIREFKEQLEIPQKVEVKTKTLKAQKTMLKNEVPEEVLAAERRKKERLKHQKAKNYFENNDQNNQGALLDSLDFQHSDLQKMVIFTEILKRPQY
jgi:hypothetical protein